MDSITHTVLGACVGEVLAGRKLGKKALLWGAIANNLPDIDVVTAWWMNQASSLLAHRGFTHSILFVLVMTALAGWVMKKIYRKNSFAAKEWAVLFGVNMFLHLFIDSFTAYGTGLFEPFSHERVTFNLLFVADPLFTLPLLVAFIAMLIMSRSSTKRYITSIVAISLSSLYLLYALYNKIEVDKIARKSLAREKLTDTNFIATPTPLNNFLWYILAANDSGYNIGYYSVFDRLDEVNFRFIPRNDSYLSDIKDNPDVQKLIRFSQGFYHVGVIHDTLLFNDLRFGQIGGWNSGDAPFVFQYTLTENADNNMAIQGGRMRASGKVAFMQMVERIRGK